MTLEFHQSGYDEIGILNDTLDGMVKGLGEREAMIGELAAAEEIQKQLLPGKMPSILEGNASLGTFYKAMSGVGWDYFDFIEPEAKEEVIFCIGDVSNHGVGPRS